MRPATLAAMLASAGRVRGSPCSPCRRPREEEGEIPVIAGATFLNCPEQSETPRRRRVAAGEASVLPQAQSSARELSPGGTPRGRRGLLLAGASASRLPAARLVPGRAAGSAFPWGSGRGPLSRLALSRRRGNVLSLPDANHWTSAGTNADFCTSPPSPFLPAPSRAQPGAKELMRCTFPELERGCGANAGSRAPCSPTEPLTPPRPSGCCRARRLFKVPIYSSPLASFRLL